LTGLPWRVAWRPARVPLAVCAIFKDEAPYLAEWIAFHQLVGVHEFYLYDNESTDDWRSAIAPFIDAGIVTVKPWPGSQAGDRAQYAAYSHCLKHMRARAQWVAFIDVDEFLFSPTGRALPDVLRDFEAHPGVVAAWRVFGTGGWTEPPTGLVTESYLLRGRDEVEFHIYEKSIVQPRRTLTHVSSPHRFLHYSAGHLWKLNGPVDETGQRRSRGFLSADTLRVNHYRSKSVTEATAKANSVKSIRPEGQLESFLDDRFNQVRDEQILQFVPQLREALAAIGRGASRPT
jgi:hypothetical protein